MRQGGGVRACTLAIGMTLLLCQAVSIGSLQWEQPDTPRVTFRAGVETVVVRVTAREKNGRLLTTLERDDFQLLMDGRPVPVEVFSKKRHALSLGIMLHPGASVPLVSRVRDIANALVECLEPDDQAFIGTFGLEVALNPVVTSNREILHRVLREELWPDHGLNRIGNALEASLAALPRDSRTRALVVIGDDSAQMCGLAPCVDVGIAQRHAVEQGVLVYGIVVRVSQPPVPITGYPVERAANATGGGYVHIDRGDDIKAQMSGVVDELRCEYLLGFAPTVADERSHDLTIRVGRPRVRAVARLGDKPSSR